jgi:hypothetical protein
MAFSHILLWSCDRTAQAQKLANVNDTALC